MPSHFLCNASSVTSMAGLIAGLLAVGLHMALIAHGQYPTSANGPPRFRQNARSHQYAYLGDSVRFRCTAVGRPQPKVHWYRNGGYLNYSFMQAHPRFREKSMSLEIRRIEVDDKGNWMCRVWNNEGSTTRNFTLHIVNYCEYFLDELIPTDRVPDECACEWARRGGVYEADTTAGDESSGRPHTGSGRLTESRHLKIRSDLDLSLYDAKRCASQNVSEEFPSTTTMRVAPTTVLSARTTKMPPTTYTTSYDDYGRASSDAPPAKVEPHVDAKKTEIHFLEEKHEPSGPGRPPNRIRIVLEHPEKLSSPSSTTEPNGIKANHPTKSFIINTERSGSAAPAKLNVAPSKYIQRVSATAKTTLKYRADSPAMLHDKGKFETRNLSTAKWPSVSDVVLSNGSRPSDKPRSQDVSKKIHNGDDHYSHAEIKQSEAAVFPSRGHQIGVQLTETNNANNQRRPNNVKQHDNQQNVMNTITRVMLTATDPTTQSRPAVSETYTTSVPTAVQSNPSQLFDHLSASGIPDVAHLLPDLIPPGGMRALRDALTTHWHENLDLAEKSTLAQRIVANLSSVGATRQEGAYDSAEDEDEENEDTEKSHYHEDQVTKKAVGQDQVENRTIGRARSSALENRTAWPGPPTRVAPYFRQMDNDVNENVVMPAGRTLKLSCRAGGQPEPQVIWRKDNVEIQRDTESRTGSLYQLRRWSLELEDAAESDSGDYECEVFNSVGWIVRRFRVDVQDRLRSRPIIVPNVLLNRTVDANSTVRFTCQVISDLVPHIVWIKLIRRNGSYIRVDAARNQQSFNFIDMSTAKKANLYHDSKTNKYTLEIVNVTMEDQGIYSCVAGNTLGMSMANATLTVNEFRPMTLPTENPYQWPFTYTVLLAVGAVLLMAFLALSILYCSFFAADSAPKRHRVQSYDKIAVRKKVIIMKKPERSGDVWSDLASSYAITVEPVLSGGSGLALDGGGGSAGGLTDALLADFAVHPSAPSDATPLSEYEVPTDTAWEIDRSKLQLIDILGEGAFGEVWKGVLRVPNVNSKDENRVPVAVKKLKPAANEKELIILVSEMQILKSIGEHRNILRLVGCCTGVGPLLVVLEVCPHGNLRDFLRKHRPRENDLLYEDEDEDEEEFENSAGEFSSGDGRRAARRVVMYQNVENLNEAIIKNLTLRDLVQFSTEIARGMEFLASKKIIHRDLAARNVLVAENYTMKISDFGLSRNVFYQDYYRKRGAGRLPIKWMAPEALEANVYTVYSDVWSYGILLWEIMTLGGTPYPSIAMPQLYNILKEGYRMEPPHNCPDEVYGVMVMCWQDKPEQRPQFQTIADYFDWMLNEAANYAMKSDDGETTDEGPYAVINETLNHPAGRIASAISGQSTTGGPRPRPLSAPEIISFEAFAIREATGRKASGPAKSAATTCQMSASRSCENELTGDERAPLLAPSSTDGTSSTGHLVGATRKKSSLIELIQSERPHHAEAPPPQPQPKTQDESHFYTNTLDMLGGPNRSGLIGDSPPRHNSDSFFIDSAIGSPLILSPLDRSAETNDSALSSISAVGLEGVYLTTKTNENKRLLSAIEEDNNSSSGGDGSVTATPSAVPGTADTKPRNTYEYVNKLVRLSPLFASQQALSFSGDSRLRKYARKSNSSNALSAGHTSLPSQPSNVLAATSNSSSKSLGQASSSSSSGSSSSHSASSAAARQSNASLNGRPAGDRKAGERPATTAAKSEKRSVASEHALRINAISGEAPSLFRSIGQQVNRKNGSTLSEASQPGSSGLGSSTILREMSLSHQVCEENAVRPPPPPLVARPPASDANNNPPKSAVATTISAPLTRSLSAESQASSGRGGSSAASSADALGAHLIVAPTGKRGVQYAIVHAPIHKKSTH